MDVLTVGHMLYDIRCYVGTFPQPDRSAIIERPIHASSGGSAANVAMNLSMLGRSTGVVCNLGLDRHGKYLFEDLKHFGVDVNGVSFMKGKSGMSIVLVDKNADVEVLTSLGVCDKYASIKPDLVANYKHLHVTGTNYRTSEEAINCAHKIGLGVSFDPGRSKSALGEKKLGNMLSKTDHLLVNRKELALICGKKEAGDDKTASAQAMRLAKKYSMDVCVKGGAKRIIVTGKDRSLLKFAPYKVHVVDSIGAGDAFAAGFIDAILEARSLEQAARFAAGCSAQEIVKPGAHSGLDKKRIIERWRMY